MLYSTVKRLAQTDESLRSPDEIPMSVQVRECRKEREDGATREQVRYTFEAFVIDRIQGVTI